VHEPHSVSTDYIALTIGRHLRDATLAHIPLNLATVDVIRLAGETERSAQVVEAGFGSLVEGRERIAEIECILGVAVEVWPERQARSSHPIDHRPIPEHRQVKAHPLNVTN